MKLPDSKYRHVIIPHGVCRQIEGLICGIHPPCGAAYLGMTGTRAHPALKLTLDTKIAGSMNSRRTFDPFRAWTFYHTLVVKGSER